MAARLACATILDAEGRRDIAVPVGTTIAGLTAMLEIDLSDGLLRLTHADGRPADGAGVIGADVPSGAVLAVNSARASSLAAHRAASRDDDPRPRLALLTAALLGALALPELLLVVAPLAGWWAVPAWARLATGVCAGCASLALMAAPGIRRRPLPCTAVSASLALAALGILTPDSSLTAWLVLPAAALAAFLGCLLWWMIERDMTTATLAVLWALAAGVGLGVSWAGAPLRLLAPAALALTVLALVVVPSIALSVPQSQLLDLPLVTTSASRVRAPEVRAPSRVTAPRVNRTLREATQRGDVLLLTLCALATACAPWTVPLMSTATWPGRGAIALVVSAVVALAVTPRHRSSRLARTLPRACAVLLVAAAAHSPAVTDAFGPLGAIEALIATALATVSGCALLTRAEGSALAGRVADILESLSVLTLLPAAALTTGAFDIVRRVVS